MVYFKNKEHNMKGTFCIFSFMCVYCKLLSTINKNAILGKGIKQCQENYYKFFLFKIKVP